MVSKLQEELKKPLVKYGLIVTAVLLVVQKAFVPWIEWRSETSQALTVKSKFAIDQADLKEALGNVSSRQKELSSDLKKLKFSFAKTGKGSARVELPTQVRQICESFGIKVNRVAVTELEGKYRGVKSYMVSLEAQGSVDKLFKLVEKLESDNAFFVVDRMTIYSRQKQQMKVRMELQKHVAV